MKSHDDIRGVLQRPARRNDHSPDTANDGPASTDTTDGPSRGNDEAAPPDGSSQSTPETDGSDATARPPDEAQHAARETVIGNDGQPIGVEDSPGVHIVSEAELQRVRDDLHTTLGAPNYKPTPKGRSRFGPFRTTRVSRSPIVRCPLSESGGPTVDFTGSKAWTLSDYTFLTKVVRSEFH